MLTLTEGEGGAGGRRGHVRDQMPGRAPDGYGPEQEDSQRGGGQTDRQTTYSSEASQAETQNQIST